MNTTIKTSGQNDQFASGAKRDAREGKGRYDLISCHALEALARYQLDSVHAKSSPRIRAGWHAVGNLARWGRSRLPEALSSALDWLWYLSWHSHIGDAGCLFPLASRLEEGAKHYGDRNWQNGMSLSGLYDSTMRHLDQLVSERTDENHLGAAMFGVAALLDHEARLRNGEKFASDVDDWPVPLPKEDV